MSKNIKIQREIVGKILDISKVMQNNVGLSVEQLKEKLENIVVDKVENMQELLLDIKSTPLSELVKSDGLSIDILEKNAKTYTIDIKAENR